MGITDLPALKALAFEKRKSGIFLTVLGFGEGKETLMEQVANHGNGNFEFIDNENELLKVFVYEQTKLLSVAKDAKIQLSFNSNSVISYRLIGYENRALNENEFRNDAVDGGEIGAGQTITALYELELREDFTNLGTISVNYKYPNIDISSSFDQAIDNTLTEFGFASDNLKLSAAIAAYGMLMKQSAHSGTADKGLVLDLIRSSKLSDPFSLKSEFEQIVEDAL